MKVQRIDYQAPDAAQQFTESLRTTGFAVLINHPIKEKNITDLYQAWETFFQQTPNDKAAFMLDPKTQIGWTPPSISEIAKGYDVKDLKEYFNFFPYGTCPENLKTLTLNIYEQLNKVAVTLLTWIQENTPNEVRQKFSQPLSKMLENTRETLFRINYYPALSGDEPAGALRAAAHEDIDLITVLTAGNQTGLQAKTMDGEWIDIPCDHGNLVINAGDMLQECSGGYYPSTTHRVLNPTGEAAKTVRMSCPLFLHPRSDVILSERYTQASYLNERLIELGIRKAN